MEDLAVVIRRSFNPEPVVVHLKSAANISDYLQPRLQSFPQGIMQFRQFQLELLKGISPIPVLKVRKKARGSEMFRGIAESTLYTPCWDPGVIEGIDYKLIPPAKRRPFLTEQEVKKYEKTITMAQKQHGLKAYQLDSLIGMLVTLESEEPIAFHWFDENLMLGSTAAAAAVASSPSETDISEDSEGFDAWDNEQRALHDKHPLLPFKLNDLVTVNSGKGPDDPEPFYLARIVTHKNPPAWNSAEGKRAGASHAGDWMVQVSWYDQTTAPVKRVHWQKAKWKEQKQSLEWILKKNIYQTLDKGLTALSQIYKKDYTDIEFYLDNPQLEEKTQVVSDDSEAQRGSDKDSESDADEETQSNSPIQEFETNPDETVSMTSDSVVTVIDGITITGSARPLENKN